MVGAVVRTRSQAARTVLIKTRSAQRIIYNSADSIEISANVGMADTRCLAGGNGAFGKRNFTARDSRPHSTSEGGQTCQIAAADRNWRR